MTDAHAKAASGSPPLQNQQHLVLARKYRPQTFSDMIGQSVLVTTLSHAIATGRLAHAWMLSGVRGVGKTTTARIIARSLNCTGAEGIQGPTVNPCGICTSCVAISEGHHVDVAEMDAASRTGVGDIRDILDGVSYRPMNARYKIYIIDEVHMLSQAAFNALLKTLEEPPGHVKFIFATTDTRKVPVTVLSRCQRFDLRRVQPGDLSAHLKRIADQEKITAEADALRLIAEAADGSVRDALSLLDQAIVYGAGQVTQRGVLEMIGLANREDILALLDSVLSANLKGTFERLAHLYESGADPMVIVSDLQERIHKITVLKAIPDLPKSQIFATRDASEQEIQYAEHLSMAVLTRAWQMLIKIQDEVRLSAHPLRALEMGLLRLAYAADMPTPGDIISQLKASASIEKSEPTKKAAHSSLPVQERPVPHGPVTTQDTATSQVLSPTGSLSAPKSVPTTFEELIHWLAERREALLAHHLEHSVSPIHYEVGRIDFRPLEQAPSDLTQKLRLFLERETNAHWDIQACQEGNCTTVHDKAINEVTSHPLIKTALDIFPSAEVRPLHGSSSSLR